LRAEARVSALALYRIDPARRMWRFYAMDVRPGLFGQWSFIREWGRIGSPGRMRIATCSNEDEAWHGSPATAVPKSVEATARPLETAQPPFRADGGH
jgi:predicted DNA-binding WGR domain protein